jgi:DnaA-homolog protein
MLAQLPLGLGLRADATFASFEAGPNGQALRAARECALGEGEALVYLWGAPGRGKTHLLQAACHAAGGIGHPAAYVPLGQAGDFATAALEGLEALALVCVDDVGAIAGQADWELALFDLFNRARESGTRLLFAACGRPGDIGLRLPDLRSRLASGLSVRLADLRDEEKLAALRGHAGARGLELSDEVGRYLLRHYPRDLPALVGLLEQLDRASLAAQRRLTIPFIRSALGAPAR